VVEKAAAVRKIAAGIFLGLVMSFAATAHAEDEIKLRMPPKMAKPVPAKAKVKSKISKAKLPVAKIEAAKPGQVTHVQSFGSWRMFCVTGRSPAPCEMFQQIVVKNTGKRVVMVSIAYAPARQTYAMEISVPLGVLIQKGLVLKSSTYTSGSLPYYRCGTDFCFVNGEIDAAALAGLSRDPSGRATVSVWNEDGKPVNLSLSLAGFAGATEAMTNLAKAGMVAPTP
jgi:invasion protein IalB